MDDLAGRLRALGGGGTHVVLSFLLSDERFRAADDLQHFLGDRGLAGFVHLQGQLVDQFLALSVALLIATSCAAKNAASVSSIAEKIVNSRYFGKSASEHGFRRRRELDRAARALGFAALLSATIGTSVPRLRALRHIVDELRRDQHDLRNRSRR